MEEVPIRLLMLVLLVATVLTVFITSYKLNHKKNSRKIAGKKGLFEAVQAFFDLLY